MPRIIAVQPIHVVFRLSRFSTSEPYSQFSLNMNPLLDTSINPCKRPIPFNTLTLISLSRDLGNLVLSHSVEIGLLRNSCPIVQEQFHHEKSGQMRILYGVYGVLLFLGGWFYLWLPNTDKLLIQSRKESGIYDRKEFPERKARRSGDLGNLALSHSFERELLRQWCPIWYSYLTLNHLM